MGGDTMSEDLIKNILKSIYRQQDVVGEDVTINASDFEVSEDDFEKALVKINERNLAEGIRIVKDRGKIKGIKRGRLRLTDLGEQYIQ
jgi:hypothetical protein